MSVARSRVEYEGVACRRLTAGADTAHHHLVDGATSWPVGCVAISHKDRQVAPMVFDFSFHDDNAGDSAARDQRSQWEEPLALVAELRRVDWLLRDDVDAAALLLDGVLWRVVSFAFERAGVQAPPRERVFEAMEALAPPVCWRLRLALRAPNAQARLLHAWALLEAVGAMRVGSAVSL